MSEHDTPPLRCSFCNKSQREVRKLIAGPTVYICDECVDVCNEILAEDGILAGRGTKAAIRAAAKAEETLAAAARLLDLGEAFAAAREVRSAALAALRGFAAFGGEAPDSWSDTKVIGHVMSNYPAVTPLLQTDDVSHVILRVSLEGAPMTASDVGPAIRTAEQLIALLRREAEAAHAERPKKKDA
jgi:hypothetical protein